MKVIIKNREVVTFFGNIYEMYKSLFDEINIGTNMQDQLYDIDTNTVLYYNGKILKAQIDINKPIYCGDNEILFDPTKSTKMIEMLFGYALNKLQYDEDYEDIGYIAHGVDRNITTNKQAVMIRTKNGDLYTNYYNYIYLAYIEAIFLIYGSKVNLCNFDISLL